MTARQEGSGATNVEGPARIERLQAGVPTQKRSPAGCGASKVEALADGRAPYIVSIALSFVSGRKMRPMKKLMAATTIGYHRPE
jgi:hypothetical protein